MSLKNFITQIVGLSIFLLAALFLLHSFSPFSSYWDISLLSLVFFTALSFLMFYFGLSTSENEDKNAFTRVALLSTAGKMMLSVVLVVIYFEIRQPEDRNFLVPFFIVYLCFTIFETSFMMKLAKKK